MKKTIGILLALILALTMLPSAAFAEGEITDFDGLKAAAGTAGEYTLGADIAVSETLEISADVTINGGGKTLTYGKGFTGSVFKVNNGGKLTLKNVVIDGGYTDWGVNTDNNTITFVAGSGIIKTDATIYNNKGTVTLEGITIKNLVRPDEGNGANQATGLLRNESGTATMTNIIMDNCFGGHGLLLRSNGGMTSVIGATVTNSVAIKNGALIYVAGNSNVTIDSLNFSNSKFRDNGLITIYYGGTISIKNSTFSNNTVYGSSANGWGGIIYTHDNVPHSITLEQTNITYNSVKETSSGSIVGNGVGEIKIKNSTISVNGGAIYVFANDTMTVDGGTIENNVRISENGHLINNSTIDGSVLVAHYKGWTDQCTGSAYVTNTGTITGDLTINTKSEDSTSSGNVKGHITVTNGKLTITGGYYGDSIEAITPYLADGLRAVPSDNPEYTCMVVPAGVVRVSFDVNGGDALVPSFTYTDGQGVLSQFPAATRANYRFNGWYTAPMGGTRIVEGSIFTADTTVFAQWTYIESGSSGDDYPIFTTPAPAPAPIGLPTTGDMTIFEMILSWLGLL